MYFMYLEDIAQICVTSNNEMAEKNLNGGPWIFF